MHLSWGDRETEPVPAAGVNAAIEQLISLDIAREFSPVRVDKGVYVRKGCLPINMEGNISPRRRSSVTDGPCPVFRFASHDSLQVAIRPYPGVPAPRTSHSYLVFTLLTFTSGRINGVQRGVLPTRRSSGSPKDLENVSLAQLSFQFKSSKLKSWKIGRALLAEDGDNLGIPLNHLLIYDLYPNGISGYNMYPYDILPVPHGINCRDESESLIAPSKWEFVENTPRSEARRSNEVSYGCNKQL